MSQKASRKSAVNEEKEKSSDTPVKEMKKKMAANAEKEKQAAEKIIEKAAEKPEKTDKNAEKTEKTAEKTDKPEKNAEKVDKAADKNEKTEKKTEKAEKKQDKQAEKKADPPAPAEKKEEKDNAKDDKSGKPEKADPKKADSKPKQNGKSSMNGTHGTEENGTVSAVDDYEDDDELVIDDRDELFPELTYDDTSDPEFEPPTPEASSRSFTRRSQAKAPRTPETPRPASDKQNENADDPSKDKVLKLKEDVPTTDRKLRSADSPKPQEVRKSTDSKKGLETKEGTQESETKEQEEKENGEQTEKIEVDVIIEVDGDDEPRKPDTNYSKSRVKVSPYRRSARADHTASSVMANYTGNNTTMEMDITETSSFVSHEEPSLDDSTYLSGLRSIRGRRSYKPLKEMTLRHISASRSAAKVTTPAGEHPSRPTGTVVGRKRKPDAEDVELATEASELSAHSKRVRLLDRLTHSFRRTASSTPLPARRAAEIVGINTDLPLTAPVAADPEALKEAPAAVPLAPAAAERDSKRCVVM